MEIKNLYKAIADDVLMLNDTVIIEDGKCKHAKISDIGIKDLYSVIDLKVNRGEVANLSGKDTVFEIQ